MKLKITNKWTAEVIELEGTEQELAYFMSNYKAQYPYWPGFILNGTTTCLHEFDSSSTFSACKKCGQANPWNPFPSITYSSSTSKPGDAVFVGSSSAALKDFTFKDSVYS